MARYWGIDLHKEYVHACEWDPVNRQRRHFRFPNTRAGWPRFIDQHLGPDCRVAIEVTGNAFEVHDGISSHVEQVLLAHPNELKRLGSRRQTDRVDAERLAKMLALGTLPLVWVPPVVIREMRALLRHREALVIDRVRCINRAKGVLRRHGYPMAKQSDVRRYLAEHDPDLPEGERFILASLLRQLEALEGELRGVDAEIARRAQAVAEVRLLLSLTGMGLVGAATVWAVIGDPARFRSPRRVTRYGGLDPSVYQSGERSSQGHISKNGSPMLRRTLIQVAYQVARRDTGPLGRFFARKQRQLGTKRAAVALARKVLIVAWRMLRTQELYRGVEPARYQRKLKQLARTAATAGGSPSRSLVVAVKAEQAARVA
ncbi:MAG: IS110 family transposase [Firmicutes bacterium]|nr:IS110 family transposase [Bacillota bacterium]